MDALPPIPIPLALRWREFRVRVLPVLFFLVAIGGVFFVWQKNITAPTLVGAVETQSAQITSPYEGKITQVSIDRFQVVLKGMPLVQVTPVNPQMALSVIQSDMNILNARVNAQLNQQQNVINYESLQRSWLVQKVDLATTRVNLELAKDELQRNESLFQQKLVSEAVYDSSLKGEQALVAEVIERSNLVVTTEAGLKSLEVAGVSQTTSSSVTFLADALEVEEQKLKAATDQAGPVTLTAPMDGMVSMIYRQEGENVAAGTAILTIAAVAPQHIISYLRQPMPFEPKVGMRLQVRTRTMRIKSGIAQIQGVGSEFEVVSNSLAIIRPGKPVDMGLPIEISMPSGLKLRPGEIIDLTLLSDN